MERASIVPDCCSLLDRVPPTTREWQVLTEIILIPPFEPDSQIVILQDNVIELLQQLGRLVWMQLVDVPGHQSANLSQHGGNKRELT